jgi:DNA polymerase-1
MPDLSGVFSVDTETDDVNWVRAKLVGLSVANKVSEAYFNIHRDGCPENLRKAFLSTAIKIGHNIKFDRHTLAASGIELRGPYEDTMIAAWLLDEEQDLGLKTLASRYLGLPNYGDFSALIEWTRAINGLPKNRRLTIWDIDENDLAEYAARDARLTYDLWFELYRRIEREDLVAVYRHWMSLLDVLYEMERIGISLDLDAAERLKVDLLAELERRRQEVFNLAGEEFNLNSERQLARFLFEKLKLTPIAKTPSGAFSVNAAALKKMYLSSRHPILRSILAYREIEKLISTYLVSMVNAADDTGVIHTTFHPTGTVTGRLASSNPNLQNIPRRGTYGKAIRKLFVARPGYKLLCADLSQAEPRYLAHISNDAELRKIFADGRDLYAEVAKALSISRDRAKIVVLAVSYGMTAQTLRENLLLSDLDNPPKITEREAQRYIDNFHQVFTGVARWKYDQVRMAGRQGYVQTFLGRKRHLAAIRSGDPAATAEAIRQAYNAPIQGSVADIVSIAMIRLSEELPRLGAQLLLQVHDELVIECPEDSAEEAREIVKKALTDFGLNVPMAAEVVIGPNWADAKL